VFGQASDDISIKSGPTAGAVEVARQLRMVRHGRRSSHVFASEGPH